jgi:hypothetical protein
VAGRAGGVEDPHEGAGPMTRWLLSVFLLVGCTTHGLVGVMPAVPNPEQAAEIVVILEWRFIGGGANFTVVLDGVSLYGLAVDEHVVLRVPPGDHILTISRRGPFLNDAAITVRAEPRQRYFYRLETARGQATSPCCRWRRPPDRS